MARTEAATVQQGRPPETALRGFSFQDLPVGFIEAKKVDGGMVTDVPRGDVPSTSAERIKNGRIRGEWCGRRGGTSPLAPKPNSDRVTGIAVFMPINGEPWVVRVSPTKIHATQTTSGWTEFSAATATKTSSEEPIDSAQFLNNLYIVDGLSHIIELDFDSKVYRVLGGSSSSVQIDDLQGSIDNLSGDIDDLSTEEGTKVRPRHVTAFGDRLVVANLIGGKEGDQPTTVKWSARLDAGVWDPNEDITAGQVALAATPSHFGDEITGLFALSDALVILRKESIWQAERQAVASAPFRFRQIVGGIGCDMPHSAAKVPGGVIFASAAHGGVFIYEPGSKPQRISQPVDDQILNDPKKINYAHGTYDPVNQEYHLAISTDDDKDLEKVWVFNLRHNAWAFDDGPTISSMNQGLGLGDVTSIDDLSGSTDNLTGTIDSLSADLANAPVVFKGTSDGEVLFHDVSDLTDVGGTQFEFEFISPNIGAGHLRRTLNQLMVWFETQGLGSGDVSLEESKDKSVWENTRTDQSIGGSAGRHEIGIGYKQIHGSNLYWRLRSTNLDVRITNWWARIIEHSPHKH